MRVPGEGPKPSRVVVIGEAPGYFESQVGRPFVGKSGRELDTFLRLGGLEREYVYVTNLVKWQPPYVNGKQQPPSKEDIARDTPDLIQELLETRPRWIGAVGRYAARWLTGLDLSMEEAHGLAYPIGDKLKGLLVASRRSVREDTALAGDRWIDRCSVVPIYHPAAALRNVTLYRDLWSDLRLFGKYATGRLEPLTSIDEFPNPDYDVYTDSMRRQDGSWIGTDVRYLFASGEEQQTMGIDTEGLLVDPWGLSISNRPGFSRVIHAEQHGQLGLLNQLLRLYKPRTIFHNLLHDWPILEAMGVEIDWELTEDTMLMLFCLCLLPLGLKPVSGRLSGKRGMRSFPEVVAPASRRLALDYVRRAIEARVCSTCGGTGKVRVLTVKGDRFKKNPERCSAAGCVDGGLWPAREGQPKWDWAEGRWKLTYGWEIQRYLRSLRADIEAGVFDGVVDEEDDAGDDSADEKPPRTIRQRWDSWDDDVREPVEALLGPMPDATLRDVPWQEANDYSAGDADVTLRNYPKIRAMVEEMGLWGAYRLDLSVIPAAAEMQKNGMKLDIPQLRKLTVRFQRDNDRIATELRELAGRGVNPGSGDQVAGLLFGQRQLTLSDDDARELTPEFSFGLLAEKQTKSGKRAATDDKVLEGLKLKYVDRPDIVRTVQLVLDHRTRRKLESIIVGLIRHADAGGRVHTRIKPATAETYRWASADPPLQNIPIRPKTGGVDLGRLIRSCFIAEEGHVIGSGDYDQVELRVLAALSGDDELLRAFREGLDPHVLGASKVWRVPYDELYARYKAGDKEAKEWRSSAKNVNFGIVYGITARGLQAQMKLRGQNWTLDECQDLIDTYLRTLFPGVGAFIQEAIDEARRYGYVRALAGHVRYVPAVWSSVPSIRAEAERQAANGKIQITAAELFKAGVRDVWQRGKRRLDQVGTRLLMGVHDEILVETPDNEEAREVTKAIVETYMENPLPMPNGVQITASLKFASNWGLLK